ncbi:MAG TPA: bifunctional alpha,alpha-trehalose-phosphate synthase (UDP-forming)/trehalose-phosphatase [Verrucomicrobiales bacterium]|nr:bifunctional alpha,alpha-trehalose-phosphate synthase (UDP-forming)/trehalose-phosphatase [Verrucomicrobiales bacterium]
MAKLVLVSNRLPVSLGPDGKPERTTGGLASALEGAGLSDTAVWVGWPGIAAEENGQPFAQRDSFRAIGAEPVPLSTADIDGFYEGYSNSTLWPVLHYMVQRARFDRDWAKAYAAANAKFAESVLQVACDGDTVWIHDYHLFLLPTLLRESGRSLRTGFFLHTPFPSSEVFRSLPERGSILKGLLGADLIGFHTFNYLRHFRSTVLRTLGVESEVDNLWFRNRQVRLGVYPIGHNRAGFEEAMTTPEFQEALLRHQARLGDRVLVLSVERLDYTKGVPQKLEAIRRYLSDHPETRYQVVFLLIAVPSRLGVQEYDELTEEVQREVGAINGDFGGVGHAPLQFLHRSFPPAELAALYARADVCLVTPLIDGMNLVAKEFVACKKDHPGTRPGAIVLSEFAGAAEEMSHALLVNPYDVCGVAETIAEAIAMTSSEKLHRTQAMRARLDRHDARHWAARFLSDLDACSTREPPSLAGDSVEALADHLAQAVASNKSLALFLDYDGTLRDFTARPEDAVPDRELGALLARLAEQPSLKVAVISGRPSIFLERHFAGLGVSLIAEHGYRWFFPENNAWDIVDPRVDNTWKDVIRPHLQQAADLTPGSSIEEKLSALVWHYRRADPEFGLWRAHGLLEELTSLSANLPVSVHHGNKIVEVASQLVNKGVAVNLLLKRWRPDVAVAAGDDQTDETMFSLEPEGIDYYTIKVGTHSTRAGRRTDIGGLRRFLKRLLSLLAS